MSDRKWGIVKLCRWMSISKGRALQNWVKNYVLTHAVEHSPWEKLKMAWSALWCRSLKHRYLCAKIPQPSNDDHFLIPLVETLLLVMQRYPIEGFSIASKLSEKNSWSHAKLAVVNILASIAGKKSAGCHSFGRNTLLCILKRLYWQKVKLNKIEWRIMFLSIVAQVDDYWLVLPRFGPDTSGIAKYKDPL